MSQIPDSYDYSQATQTQQTQTQSTAHHFPSQLWGFLVSCAPSASEMDLANEQSLKGIGAVEVFVKRPERVELRLEQMEYTIGRLPKSDVVLNGKKVSANHARIFRGVLVYFFFCSSVLVEEGFIDVR